MTEEKKKGAETKEKRKEPSFTEIAKRPEKPMSTFAIILIIAYLILFSIFLLYSLMQIWPPSSLAKESAPTTSEITFLFCTFSISYEVRLFLIVALAGALGGMVHALRSAYWYAGHRALVRSWLTMYILLPFVGATLAIIFYLVIRGGFFSIQATAKQISPFGFAALAGLVGMFTEQAVLKLKQVFETLLAKAPKGENSKPQEEK